ncbi:MAG TPA: hypothetical protein VH575_17475 [Gemmataceae bacterium]|jgi:hypothetical protein
MRALSGAIITAAALIGLGLTAQGIGTRYENFLIYKPAATKGESTPEGTTMQSLKTEPDFEKSEIKIRDLDNPMKLCLIVLIAAVLIGLIITFIGLALHHHRRYHEHLRLYGQPAQTPSSHVPT